MARETRKKKAADKKPAARVKVTLLVSPIGFRNPAAQAWTGEVHIIDIGAPRKLIDEYRHRGN